MGKKLQSKKNSSTGGRNSKTTRNDKKDSNNDKTWVDELRLHPILGCHHPTVIIDDHNTNRDNKEDSGSGSASASRTGGILPTTTTPTSCPNEPNDEPVSISIVSWNVLAEAYCSRRSHRNLPHYYQQHVFSTLRRRALIKDILVNKLAVLFDVICLQEVDRSEISNSLRDCGYRCIETPRSIKGNSGGRVDSCLICVKEQNWTILDYELIRLDDLATLASSSTTTASSSASESESESGSQMSKKNGDDNVDSKTSNSKNSNSNIQGIQQAFLRRNVALVVRLASVKDVNKTVVIANAHLFWNPSYEYVKLCQAHYILQRSARFLKHDNEPFLFCGDFNSHPGGTTHTYLSTGSINAKEISPWYTNYSSTDRVDDEEEAQGEEMVTKRNKKPAATDGDVSEILDKLTLYKMKIKATEEKNEGNKESTERTTTSLRPQMRYLLDATLNKFCRWLRILGQDAALETEEEEKLRTGDGEMVLFDRCVAENRTLVTTSTRLLHRRDCPSSVYCISPQTLPRLEVALVHMLLTHGVVLEPRSFLSRCVMCNGIIVAVDDFDSKKRILAEYQAPTDLLDDNMDVYECNKCRQGYWWCDRPTSSASRVKNTACELFELCLRAGVPCADRTDDDDDMFQHLDRDQLAHDGWDYTIPGSDMLRHQLDAIGWMKNEKLQSPLGLRRLENAYALKDKNGQVIGEQLPFTNVTYDYVGMLDYIFYDTQCLIQQETLFVPKSFNRLNSYKIVNGHLLPSNIWPSDHLAVGATFVVRNSSTCSSSAQTPQEQSTSRSGGIVNEQLGQRNKTTSHDPVAETVYHENYTLMGEKNNDRISQASTTTGTDSLEPATAVDADTKVNDDIIFCGMTNDAGVVDSTLSFPPVPKHSARCNCGCVPPIPTLFEMAQMRREAAAAAKKKSASYSK